MQALQMANMNLTDIYAALQELKSIGNTAPTFFAPAVAVRAHHSPLHHHGLIKSTGRRPSRFSMHSYVYQPP